MPFSAAAHRLQTSVPEVLLTRVHHLRLVLRAALWRDVGSSCLTIIVIRSGSSRPCSSGTPTHGLLMRLPVVLPGGKRSRARRLRDFSIQLFEKSAVNSIYSPQSEDVESGSGSGSESDSSLSMPGWCRRHRCLILRTYIPCRAR